MLQSNDIKSDWDLVLDTCLFAHRIAVNRIIEDNPFYLLYGRDVNLPSDLVYGTKRNVIEDDSETKEEYKFQLVNRLKKLYQEIEQKYDKNVSKYVKKYNQVHKDVQYQVGDKVLVYWPTHKPSGSQKLFDNCEGPYTIIEKLDRNAYRVQREDGRTFALHIQRLMKYEPRLFTSTLNFIMKETESMNIN